MDDQFRAKLDAKLAEYRAWSTGRDLASCRLVHYCGVDLGGAKSLHATEVESEIEGLVCEGFYVDWAEHENRLYLRVWEFGGPEPEWSKVFAEVPLADVDELMRRAGFNG
jgi:hypothetical protein